MAENTAIEWADHTFNPWTGCTKVSPGCDHCYAEAWAKRSGTVRWGASEPRRRTTAANWRLPIKWNAQAEREGRRFRVFCSSLADVFDNAVPEAWRVDMLRLIAETPNLDWLLLTKRIGNAYTMMVEAFRAGWPGHGGLWDRWPELFRNVWLGATVVDQAEADRDVPKLLAVPARVRFLSIEPMLGPISFEGLFATDAANDGSNALEALDWIICGGESGPHARPMHPDWARSLRDQCAAADVPFLFKQWGEHSVHEIGDDGSIRPPSSMSLGRMKQWRPDLGRYSDVPKDALCSEVFAPGMSFALPVGKKAAGRQLDGRTHDGFPA